MVGGVAWGQAEESPPPAAGGPPQKAEARVLFDEGVRAYNAGHYAGAEKKFTESAAKDPELPGAWRWLGLVYRAQKRCRASIEAYQRYLKLRPVSQYTERVRREVELCRKELGLPARPANLPAGSGAVAVVADIEGAQVSVDGLARGATPLEPLPASPGTHEVTVSKPCHVSRTASVEVIEGQVSDLRVEMPRDPAAPREQCDERLRAATVKTPDRGAIKLAGPARPTRVTVDGAPVAVAADGWFEAPPGIHAVSAEFPGHAPWERRVVVVRGERREFLVEMRSTAERTRLRRFAWASLGLAAAAGALGVVYGIKEADTFDRARDLVELELARSPSAMAPYTSRAEIERLRDEASGQRTLALIGTGVALAAVGAAVGFFVVERDERIEGQPPALLTRLRVAPVAAADGCVIAVAGRLR
jgi:hypothetical protein